MQFRWAMLSLALHCATFLLALLAALGLSQTARATDTPSNDANNLDVRQFHIDNARIPGHTGLSSARQSVIAWQVNQGTWNGQTLDGLCLVLVQSHSEAGPARQSDCYISHEATAAQREALLGAFMATQPQLLSPRDLATLRLESAVITLEVDGQTVILHLGLIA